jgi:hypothetical protein
MIGTLLLVKLKHFVCASNVPLTLKTELGQVGASAEAQCQSHRDLDPAAWPSVRSTPTAGESTQRVLAAVHVHAELQIDQHRRNRNIVHGYGLKPVDGVDEVDLSAQLCENSLPVKPTIYRIHCRRLAEPRSEKELPHSHSAAKTMLQNCCSVPGC